MFRISDSHKAYIMPFAVFMVLLGIIPLVGFPFKASGSIFLSAPQYWVFPVQTLLCGALLWRYRAHYPLARIAKPGFTLFIAILVFVIWISPQHIFRAAPRTVGFDPTLFQANRSLFAATLLLRFLRLVIVVPLLEEIFWRGFLLRDLIHPDFTKVPIGAFTGFSFFGVAIAFGLAHWGPDFVPAVITGALYNAVAYRTRSLSSCVTAHAVTNLLLGIYIMQTRQWGFW